jgi:phage tail protein X
VHHFLVDDFVRAVNTRTLPVVNAWEAARYTVPGIFAHQSAMHGAVRLDIPDLGVPPMPVGTRVAKA